MEAVELYVAEAADRIEMHLASAEECATGALPEEDSAAVGPQIAQCPVKRILENVDGQALFAGRLASDVRGSSNPADA